MSSFKGYILSNFDDTVTLPPVVEDVIVDEAGGIPKNKCVHITGSSGGVVTVNLADVNDNLPVYGVSKEAGNDGETIRIVKVGEMEADVDAITTYSIGKVTVAGTSGSINVTYQDFAIDADVDLVVRNIIRNRNSGSSAGISYTVQNDAGDWTSFGQASSGAPGDVASSCIILHTGGDMTVSIWFRKHNTGGGRPIGKWSPTTGQQFLMESTGLNVRYALYVDGVQILDSNPNVLTLNVWNHIALTYDGSNMKIYVDGVEQGTRSQSGNISSRPNTDLLIGESSLNGEIGHVALWDNGLSADEVKSLANGISPLKISPDTLLEYFPINGQSPEPGIVHGCNAVVNGTTVVDEPPIPNSIKAP